VKEHSMFDKHIDKGVCMSCDLRICDFLCVSFSRLFFNDFLIDVSSVS